MLNEFIRLVCSAIGGEYIFGAQGEDSNKNGRLEWDCSGLGVWALQKLKLLAYDTTAAGLYSLCKPVKRTDVQVGDWVFRADLANNIKHIGYVVMPDVVVHAKGTAYGVVIEPLDRSQWTNYGRPSFFEKQITDGGILTNPFPEPQVDHPANIVIRGTDARWFVWELCKKGHNLLLHSDYFGTNSWAALRAEQEKRGMDTRDADAKTRAMLTGAASDTSEIARLKAEMAVLKQNIALAIAALTTEARTG